MKQHVQGHQLVREKPGLESRSLCHQNLTPPAPLPLSDLRGEKKGIPPGGGLLGLGLGLDWCQRKAQLEDI